MSLRKQLSGLSGVGLSLMLMGWMGYAQASRANGVKGTVGIGILCQDPDTGRKLWRPKHAETWHEKHRLHLFKTCVARNFFQAQGRTAMGHQTPTGMDRHQELMEVHSKILKLLDYAQAIESGVSDERLQESFPQKAKPVCEN